MRNIVLVALLVAACGSSAKVQESNGTTSSSAGGDVNVGGASAAEREALWAQMCEVCAWPNEVASTCVPKGSAFACMWEYTTTEMLEVLVQCDCGPDQACYDAAFASLPPSDAYLAFKETAEAACNGVVLQADQWRGLTDAAYEKITACMKVTPCVDIIFCTDYC